MLEFSHTDTGVARVFTIQGALKILNAPDLKALIDGYKAEGKLHLVADMNTLTYVDSSGLGTLINSGRELREAGGNLLLARVPDNIRDMLRVAGLLQFFQVYDSVDEAVAALAS